MCGTCGCSDPANNVTMTDPSKTKSYARAALSTMTTLTAMMPSTHMSTTMKVMIVRIIMGPTARSSALKPRSSPKTI